MFRRMSDETTSSSKMILYICTVVDYEIK
jgi:hypothetical protein